MKDANAIEMHCEDKVMSVRNEADTEAEVENYSSESSACMKWTAVIRRVLYD